MQVRKVAVAVAVAGTVLFPAVPAQARANICQTQPGVAQVSKTQPYEDQMFAPERLAPFATGAGVRVAVIDSGVDAGHPQLRGRVAAGRDFLHGDATGRQDCIGHGTAVASIIAARPAKGAGMRGLAPAATIVPIRVSEQIDTEDAAGSSDRPVSPVKFAQAIDWAVDEGNADVINMSLVMTADDPSVRAAVARAVARGVVVVAAAGNDGKPDDANLRPYPASYPDVIGVGAIGPDGVAGDFSQHGDWVDLTAPGVDVTFAARRSGHTSGRGTSYASPFVAATAALVKQRFPSLTPAQVARRILATADPAPGGRRSDKYGVGVVNPYRALTETLGPDTPPAPAPVVMHTEDPATVALAARRAHAQDMSLLVAAIGAGVVLLVVVVAAAMRRGRRRGWRPPGPELP
ncbi:type VII secretion-associated serine protease mycosin [Actinoplanes friuliensis]|uniref:Peptidase S8 and S53 subtilisin kexin sedolisin n=1 Tax=Actinoplanes friuliensis DSM 7358 TaxID=1246995 RepID=U5W0I9_9ACTN|nr:type VII secretion-associated serine protease mycosin [Actinoplanes friuliensis]AGZ42614.1 peptidase S8 and S53 subtilisin kexin sedolisin [Actinoplanes friuliensis DSM 7358]